MNAEWQATTKAPDIKRTFYVLRNTKYGSHFTKFLNPTCPSSEPRNTINDATPFSTLADAVAAQKRASDAVPTLRYEIVMVSRSVTTGVLKSPAKTVRRVVDEQEALQRGALWALANPYSHVVPGSGAGISWVTQNGETAGGLNAFRDTPLFVSLKALVEFVAEYPSLFANHGVNIARVVEEKTPEVRTEDVVTDILTPLP